MNIYNVESRTHGAYTQIYLATLNFLPSNTWYADTFCSHCTGVSFDSLRDAQVVEEMARTYRDQRASHRQWQVVAGESCNFNLRLQFLRDAVRRKIGDTRMKLAEVESRSASFIRYEVERSIIKLYQVSWRWLSDVTPRRANLVSILRLNDVT